MILEIVLYPDPRLKLKCEPVQEVTPEIRQLAADMLETMYAAPGVGLAAPQVGRNIRMLVMDDGAQEEERRPRVIINPRLTLEGEKVTSKQEGCLSVPGKSGIVTRPNYVKVKAYDRDMNPIELEGTELLARAFCHEIDHLDGHLYVEKVEGELADVEEEA